MLHTFQPVVALFVKSPPSHNYIWVCAKCNRMDLARVRLMQPIGISSYAYDFVLLVFVLR